MARSIGGLIRRYLAEGKFDYAYILYMFVRKRYLKLSELVQISKNLGYNRDIRTIYRWVRKLCERGILEKVERGLYKLSDNVDTNIEDDVKQMLEQRVASPTLVEVQVVDLEENTASRYVLPDVENIKQLLDKIKPGLGKIIEQLMKNDKLLQIVERVVNELICRQVRLGKPNIQYLVRKSTGYAIIREVPNTPGNIQGIVIKFE